MASAIDPRTPVLVGIGVASQRHEDPSAAKDALGLMLDAVQQAGADCTVPALLADAGQIAVPRGRWRYGNPAGVIARAIGAERATTIGASVGVLQQTLLSGACSAIAAGSVNTALVVGGDAGYRIVRAQVTGTPVTDTEDAGRPDIMLAPADELRHPAELQAGLQAPMGLYAMIETAYRARQSWTIAGHAERIARLYSRFSEIAAGNEHAWKRQPLSPEAIGVPSQANPIQAFPYNKLHCTFWNVDQAAALLFCSTAKAEAMGVPRGKWIFPLASSESNHMVQTSARRNLAACPGAGIAGRAALNAAGLRASELDLVELYSCFPVAVELYAAELGLSLDDDLTVTGGMAFAGGPYNNYVFQATCRMVELLRERGGTGLVGSVSGVVTKQGFGVWSTRPNAAGYGFADVTNEVERMVGRKPVHEQYEGAARVAGYTVLHNRGQPPRAIVVADTPEDARVVARSEAPEVVARLLAAEFHGAPVTVGHGVFSL